MSITVDRDKFDALQRFLIEQIIRSIRGGLQRAGISDYEKLHKTTGDIAFGIAAIIDGSASMEFDNQLVIPALAFSKELTSDELIVPDKNGGSWMHEYVFGVLDEVFESDDPKA